MSEMTAMSKAIREQIEAHAPTLSELPTNILRDYTTIVGAFYHDLRDELAGRKNTSELDVEAYAVGICTASVCCPADMPATEVERQMNREHPTGISSPWKVVANPAFADGHPNPNPCEKKTNYLHRLMEC